ncbi:hypothetical protein P691DRAFT_774109 [Macrolepiota fuliginosa MF-IS2]|uniref:Uncharacterized protein n=1 Tax=Macrolepiota fuliginosa MF-IS2 TaxID=1400762 RepID=A0A9P5XF35_9AGAR|nr:hypothetical protein P691DRAFT_774109 [Macrolepiota fuliginosa MF-IS2]
MSPRLQSTAIIFLLPFLTEGVRGLGLPRDLEIRQFFSPTSDPRPLPSPTPFVILNDFAAVLNSCTLHNVSWTFAGPSTPLSLVATNFGVPQDPPPSLSSLRPTPTFSDGNVLAVPSGASNSGTVTTTIVGDVDPLASSVPWNVNVPAGWYQIVATARAQFEAQSSPFYVQLGSDTSCLVTSPPPSSSGSSSPGSTPLPSPTPGESTTPIPISASKDTRIGVIVGVVAGVVVFMILVLMVYLCLRRRKNAPDRPIGGKTGGAQLTRGWGGLGSLDSAHANKLNRRSRASRDITAVPRNIGRHSVTGSTGAIFAEYEDQRSGHSTPFSPSEEKFSTSPVSYAKNPFDDAEGSLALATLPSNGGRPASLTSFRQEQISPTHPYPSTVDSLVLSNEPPYTPGRRSSVDASSYPPVYPSPLPHHPYSSSPVVAADMARTSSVSSSGGAASSNSSHQQKKKVNRQSTGAQSITARKTPRKPVPAYDPSIPSTISTYTSTPGSSSPSPATPLSTSSPFTSSAQGHYAKKAQHGTNTPESTAMLAHKSSFGPGGVEGKPVHYLMPDMPLPRKD